MRDLPSARWTPPAGSPRPVLVAVPHAGRLVPPELLRELRAGVDPAELSDRFVDLLALGAPGVGIGVVAGLPVRSFLDLNRAPSAIDPRLVSGALADWADPDDPRARAGLGVLPRLGAAGRPLRRRRLSREELLLRLHRHHLGYHRLIARRLAVAAASCGGVLLVDLHSTPEIPGITPFPDIVLSDACGASCAREVTEALAAFFRARGLSVAINSPFEGGYTIRRHAAPARGRHAIQIECARTLYLAADGRRPGPGLPMLMRLFDEFWAWLGEHAAALLLPSGEGSSRLAAE